MKPSFLLLCLLLAGSIVFGQKKNDNKDIPGYGNIEKSVLEKKVCDFDKDAEAEVLFDVGEFVCDVVGNIQLEKHVRIKILKESGLDHANVKIRYHSYRNDESIMKFQAHTYNVDANGTVVATPVDKKSIIEKPLNKRYTEMVIAFPNVKVGSVIEYKYIHRNPGFPRWYFQRDIPVDYSRLKTDVPTQLEINLVPYCSLEYQAQEVPVRGDRSVKQFSMSNVPALRDEPFISTDDDYLQRVDARLIAVTLSDGRRQSLVRSWPGIIKELMEDDDFGVQLKKNIPRTDDLEAALRTVTNPYERMKTIHHYVTKNMTDNGYTSIYSYDGVKSAWKDKKGTASEINLILVNLLKDAGLDAYPVLVSTRENGQINTLIPSFEYFDKVMAYVIIDEHAYVLDASDKNTPTHLIPEDVLVTQGLVIEKLETYQWGWRTLWNNKALKKNMIIIQGNVDDAGSLKGEAVINSNDYARIPRTELLKKGKDDYRKAYLTKDNSDIQISDLTFENETHDSLPLVQKFKYSTPLGGSGDYRFFSVNMFTGLEKNPFVAEDRFSDVFFGINQSYTIIGNFKIPEGYVVEDAPKNVRMMMPDTSITFSRITASENGTISVRINLDFKQPFYSVQDYPNFREFYKKLFELLSEQYVIRKKSAAIPKP